MPGIDFRLLRRQVGMRTVLDLLGFVATQRRGRQVRGACPIHDRHAPPTTAGERAPRRCPRSFSAHLEKNVYRCFHCGASGNQLDLWAAASRQPLYQAAIALCAKLNRPVPRLPRGPCGRKNPYPPVDTDRGISQWRKGTCDHSDAHCGALVSQRVRFGYRAEPCGCDRTQTVPLRKL
jgi:hypothetical protein